MVPLVATRREQRPGFSGLRFRSGHMGDRLPASFPSVSQT